MNGFGNIKERVKLREKFKEATGNNWENSQGEPDVDYVLWLESKLLDICDIEARSEQLKAFADFAQKRMWEDGDKDLYEFVDEFISI